MYNDHCVRCYISLSNTAFLILTPILTDLLLLVCHYANAVIITTTPNIFLLLQCCRFSNMLPLNYHFANLLEMSKLSDIHNYRYQKLPCYHNCHTTLVSLIFQVVTATIMAYEYTKVCKQYVVWQ